MGVDTLGVDCGTVPVRLGRMKGNILVVLGLEAFPVMVLAFVVVRVADSRLPLVDLSLSELRDPRIDLEGLVDEGTGVGAALRPPLIMYEGAVVVEGTLSSPELRPPLVMFEYLPVESSERSAKLLPPLIRYEGGLPISDRVCVS